MSGEMVERVAKLIWERFGGSSVWMPEGANLGSFEVDVRELAREIIDEIREPTEEMKAVTVPAGTEFPARAYWNKMLDAALEGGKVE